MPRRPSHNDPGLIFRVAELFFAAKKSVRDIVDEINQTDGPVPPLTREQVYPLLARARELNFVTLTAPSCTSLAQSLALVYGCAVNDLSVIQTPGRDFNAYVAKAAAKVASLLLEELGRTKSLVTIGLGPGRATLDFAREFGRMLSLAMPRPQLRLVSISAGSPANMPEYAATSFFNLFPTELVQQSFGLFAQPIIKARQVKKIKDMPNVREVVEASGQIDMIITSMGDVADEHDLLRLFLEPFSGTTSSLAQAGWIGNVQYRPYTREGFITERPDEYRAFTLFELEQFRDIARTKGKHVILIARQCGKCGMTRARALRPLMEVESMKLWSKIVMDAATARELLRDKDADASGAN